MKVVPLKELCQIRHGGTPSKANPDFWRGNIPWVSPKDMKVSALEDATDHISEEAIANSAASLVPEGSILVVVRSGILVHSIPVAQAKRSLAFNQDIKALIPNTDRIDSDYLFWFVRAQEPELLARGVKKGATVHSLQSGAVENLRVPVPNLEQQRQIVDLLSRAEGIVRLRREAQKKAAEIIPALFIDMFGDPATNPKGWPVRALGELLRNGPSNGLYKHQSAYGSGTPILRIDGFYDGKVQNLALLKRVSLDSEAERNRFALTTGDIVINRVNSPEYLGKSAIIPALSEPTVYESNMMRFAVDTQQVLPEFVIALLQQPTSRRQFLAKAKHAINQSSINQQDVKSLPVILPPLAAQTRFEEVSRSLLSVVAQQTEALKKAEATFQVLLSRTFSRDLPASDPIEEAAVA
jgi:type I restriction enzyme, S subunit